MHLIKSSGILSIPKIFIKVIRGLQALEVLTFQSPGFLKVLQYTESPNHLQIWPKIKVWSWYWSITLKLSLPFSFIYRESSGLVGRRYLTPEIFSHDFLAQLIRMTFLLPETGIDISTTVQCFFIGICELVHLLLLGVVLKFLI